VQHTLNGSRVSVWEIFQLDLMCTLWSCVTGM